jgi:phenylalanine-4-hydroxylase
MQRTNKTTSEAAKLRTTVLFSISDHIGALDEVLQIVKAHQVNLARIESRPSRTADWDYDFFIDLITTSETIVPKLVESLTHVVKNVKIVGHGTTSKGIYILGAYLAYLSWERSD